MVSHLTRRIFYNLAGFHAGNSEENNMNIYYITVSLNGIFMFNTTDDSDLKRVKMAVITLNKGLPQCTIEVMTKPASMVCQSTSDFFRTNS